MNDMIESMLSESETAELRSLHERAYARDGGLTAEDLERLQELERQRRGVAAEAGSASEEVPDPSTGSGNGPSAGSALGPGSEEVDDSDLGGGRREPLRQRRRWLAVVAAAAALIVGLGAGWMLWGWNSAEFALAATHSDKRTELESTGDFDPGTVVAVSEQHGIVMWRAERSEGEEQCVIVTTESITQSGCGTMDDPNMGAPGAATTVPDGDELAGQTFSAFLLRSATGEIVPTVQIWDNTGRDWEEQYTEEELETISRLEAEGFTASELGILGYDGDRAVWSTWNAEGMCVIAESDDGIVRACADDLSPDEELTITTDVDGVPTRYVVSLNEQRGPQLTVMKLSLPEEVTIGDPEIDDKTGESETGE